MRPRLIFFLFLVILLADCSPITEAAPTSTINDAASLSEPQSLPSPNTLQDTFSDLPEAARRATRPGDPRSTAYWALWNSCAPDNRADIAAANGGWAAGWILMDDLIADPGIQLGDYPVVTCQKGLALLQDLPDTGELIEDPIFAMAAELFAAELNLNVNAETCPIAEEAVLSGHMLLAGAGFDGTRARLPMNDELSSAIPKIIELLRAYNRGELCR